MSSPLAPSLMARHSASPLAPSATSLPSSAHAMPRAFIEEKIIEVQRRGPNGVWSDANLDLEVDGPGWFESRTGKAMALDALPLPVGWEWTTNWKISTHEPDSDAEGWVRDVRDANLRRRWWKRRRDSLVPTSLGNTSSSFAKAATSSPMSAPRSIFSNIASSTSTNSGDPAQSAMEALQRLDLAVQRIPTDRDAILEARRTVQECESALESLTTFEKPGSSARATRVKLGNDLQRVKARMDKAIAESEDKNRSGRRQQVQASSSHSTAPIDHDAMQAAVEQEKAQQLRLVQIVSEVDYNESLIHARRDDLLEINKKAIMVNGMMKDLASMVNSQGESISVISKNASEAKANAQGGLKEVQKAEKIQDDGQCVIS